MIENHVPVQVLSNSCPDRMSGCKIVFAPYIFNMTDEMSDRFINYVRTGGSLYFSGAGNERMLNELVGAKYTGSMTKETRTYISPAKGYESIFGEFNDDFPMPFDCPLPIAELSGDESAAAYITLPYTARAKNRFASIHQIRRPYVPGIRHLIRKYGKAT